MGITPKSIKIFSIILSSAPTEIIEANPRFLTKPQFGPSGVSAGHIFPHCVGCKSLASK